MTQAPLLFRLLHAVDQQASVQNPVPMGVVVAALLAPVVVDAIAAHKQELQALILGEPADNAHKGHKAPATDKAGPGTAAHARAMSAAIVEVAVRSWRELEIDQNELQVTQCQKLLDCLTLAAVDAMGTATPQGLLPRASLSASKSLLSGFWHKTLAQSEVRAALVVLCPH